MTDTHKMLRLGRFRNRHFHGLIFILRTVAHPGSGRLRVGFEETRFRVKKGRWLFYIAWISPPLSPAKPQYPRRRKAAPRR